MRVRYLMLGLASILVGCRASSDKSDNAPPKEGSAGFSAVKPSPLVRLIEQPAVVEAEQEATLVPGIPGYVLELYCDIGTRVKGPSKDSQGKAKPGDVLATLSVPEVEVDLKEKEALVEQAKAEKKLAEESVKAAEAEQNRLLSQWQRLSKLKETVTKEEVEESRLAYEVAKARWSTAKEEIEVRKARLKVAEENRNRARTMLDYAEIRAPFDGVVTQRNVKKGDYVQPGARATPAFVMASTDRLRVVARIPEVDAACITDKMDATARVKDREFPGKIARTSKALDPKSRTLRVEIDLPSDSLLVAGMYAHISLTARPPGRWTVPLAAVADLGEPEPYCFLLEDGKARKTPVKTGVQAGKLVEIVFKQIGAGDETRWVPFTGQEQVVIGNLSALSDGQTVPGLK